MNTKQKIHTILSGYNHMVAVDPTAALDWLEEKIEKLEDDEREELEKQAALQNIPLVEFGG